MVFVVVDRRQAKALQGFSALQAGCPGDEQDSAFSRNTLAGHLVDSVTFGVDNGRGRLPTYFAWVILVFNEDVFTAVVYARGLPIPACADHT
jgi:hypothetical protein